jgi:hypothetical protein
LQGNTLYVPLKFNLKAVDAIHVTVKDTNAKVIPIQIKTSDWHSDSEKAFFAQWNRWIEPLKGFKITPCFLWIVEDMRDRAGTIMAWPKHTTRWVSIDQVDRYLHTKLAGIRAYRSKSYGGKEGVDTVAGDDENGREAIRDEAKGPLKREYINAWEISH